LSTEEVTKGVASATKVADQAGATIKALHDTLGDAAEAAALIVASASQQSIGMNQIHQAMKNIDQVTRQNSAAMQQAEQAARDLNSLGDKLDKLVSVRRETTQGRTDFQAVRADGDGLKIRPTRSERFNDNA
jgi:methyl-accepting chemotaxis protein